MYNFAQAVKILGVTSARMRTWCAKNIITASATEKLNTYSPPTFTYNDLFTIFVFARLVDWGVKRKTAESLAREIVHMTVSYRINRTTIAIPNIRGLRVVIAKRQLRDEFDSKIKNLSNI